MTPIQIDALACAICFGHCRQTHIVHDQIVHPVGFVQPCVINGDQIRMADAARQLRFADETIDKLLISLRDTGIQNFQGEIRVDDTMPHKIYRPHAAMAKFLLDRVFLKFVPITADGTAVVQLAGMVAIRRMDGNGMTRHAVACRARKVYGRP